MLRIRRQVRILPVLVGRIPGRQQHVVPAEMLAVDKLRALLDANGRVTP